MFPSSSGRALLVLTEYYNTQTDTAKEEKTARKQNTLPFAIFFTLKRLLLAGVDGCKRRSSDWGSWTFSMPAPSSSFFSRAEYASPSAEDKGTDRGEIKPGCRND